MKLLCAIRTGDAWIRLCFKVDRMGIAGGEVIESGNVQDFPKIFQDTVYTVYTVDMSREMSGKKRDAKISRH